MKASSAAIDALKAHEGFRPRMYRDQAGLPTIGYGTLIDTAGEQHLLTATITEAEGEELLRRDLAAFEHYVNDAIKVHIAQNQFDALVVLAYNIGPTAFRTSTLVSLINRKSDPVAISAAWRSWRMAGGQVSNGLVTRRREELAMYWRHLWSLSVALFIIAAVALGSGAYLLA